MSNTKPKHTPGPWKISRTGSREHPNIIYSGEAVKHGSLIYCPGAVCKFFEIENNWHEINTSIEDVKYNNEQEQTTNANAHLIAAAPEMYEVLEMALSVLRGANKELRYLKEQNDPSLYFAPMASEQILGPIKAALAKARGEQR